MEYSILLISVIALALIFDFINGFHDAANSIATVVSTKVLTPFQAVVWAAFFNFVAFFIFKDHSVATTIAKSVKETYITAANNPLAMIFSGLLAAITWNLVTWWYGIPSSSSHTLIGGFAGAFLAAFGWQAINGGIIMATAIFIFVAPIAGMLMSYLISVLFLNSFRKGPFMKIVSITIITLVVFAVYNALELKRDFNGGSSYTMVFEKELSKEDVKKLLTIKTDDLKEYIPLVTVASADKDAGIARYTIRFDYLKRDGDTVENKILTAAILERLAAENKVCTIEESHRITETSEDRYDASNLKSSFETYWLKVIFHGSNFK